MDRLTVCVTGAGAGVDSVREQKKLEVRKMLVNRADSPASSARFVRRVCGIEKILFHFHCNAIIQETY